MLTCRFSGDAIIPYCLCAVDADIVFTAADVRHILLLLCRFIFFIRCCHAIMLALRADMLVILSAPLSLR